MVEGWGEKKFGVGVNCRLRLGVAERDPGRLSRLDSRHWLDERRHEGRVGRWLKRVTPAAGIGDPTEIVYRCTDNTTPVGD